MKMEYTDEQVGKFLETRFWKWAKTYAKKAPHWYSLKDTWKEKALFLEIVKHILKHGKEEYYYSYKNNYFYYGEYKYWVMSMDANEVGLINRTKINWYDVKDGKIEKNENI